MKTILFVALALVAAYAYAQTGKPTTNYILVPGNEARLAWRMDATTGAISACVMVDYSNVTCTKWNRN